MMRRILILTLFAGLLVVAGCSGDAKPSPEDDHGHDHPAATDDHGHDDPPAADDYGHDDHGHDHASDSDDHGHDDPPAADDHGHDDPPVADEHGHDHASSTDDHGHDGASEVVTLWGEGTQLFVEFPALVVGEESPFAAHLTRLRDHFALDEGRVTVELSGGPHPVERFSVDHPSPPGIFRPVVRPAREGIRRVTLRLDSSLASEVHEMGEFRVYATRAEAEAAPEREHDGSADGGDHGSSAAISFLLEQQWKVPFQIERVDVRPLRPNLPALARLTLPSDGAAIVAAPRNGRVSAVGGRFPLVGEVVRAGAKLFALSSAPQDEADSATLDLAVEQAEIRIQSAQREVDRLRPLVQQEVVAQRRLDEAAAELSAAQADLRSARRRQTSLEQSQQVEGRSDGLRVPSPIAGTIAELHVAPGAWVTQGQPLARIVDRDRLWLDIGVPEAYVGRLRDVSGAWFRLDNYDGVFEVPRAALVSIGAEVDPATRTLLVRFRIDNVRGELFAGMTTQAHLIADAPRITAAVPMDAVVDDGGTDVVYVQTGGESFERRPIRLGIRDGLYVEALDGLVPGEWVVARGAYSVKLASTSTAAIGHGHAH